MYLFIQQSKRPMNRTVNKKRKEMISFRCVRRLNPNRKKHTQSGWYWKPNPYAEPRVRCGSTGMKDREGNHWANLIHIKVMSIVLLIFVVTILIIFCTCTGNNHWTSSNNPSKAMTFKSSFTEIVARITLFMRHGTWYFVFYYLERILNCLNLTCP